MEKHIPIHTQLFGNIMGFPRMKQYTIGEPIRNDRLNALDMMPNNRNFVHKIHIQFSGWSVGKIHLHDVPYNSILLWKIKFISLPFEFYLCKHEKICIFKFGQLLLSEWIFFGIVNLFRFSRFFFGKIETS